jgi:hypothetical protein
MIKSSDTIKRYASAHKRFLKASISGFFDRSFPRFFGTDIRDRIADEIIALIEKQMPATEHLRPGQCLWNAVSIETRADSSKLQLVPVILTLVDDTDITRLSTGEPPFRVAEDSVARLLREAYNQGALLSMRDIGLLTWHYGSVISQWRKNFEDRHQELLPHPGNVQDFGSCLTHKVAIVVKAIYEKKDTLKVAQETKHTQQAVDRYLKDFHRVRICYRQNPDMQFICQVTGMSRHLVNQYLEILGKYENKDLTGSPA